jgi:hypothetical protein
VYLFQQILTVILSLFGIATLRALIRYYLPNIKEWHLDVILGLLVVSVLIINWKIHDQDTKQILQLQARAQPRSIDRTQKLIDELSADPRKPIYVIADDYENEIKEYWGQWRSLLRDTGWGTGKGTMGSFPQIPSGVTLVILKDNDLAALHFRDILIPTGLLTKVILPGEKSPSGFDDPSHDVILFVGRRP